MPKRKRGDDDGVIKDSDLNLRADLLHEYALAREERNRLPFPSHEDMLKRVGNLYTEARAKERSAYFYTEHVHMNMYIVYHNMYNQNPERDEIYCKLCGHEINDAFHPDDRSFVLSVAFHLFCDWVLENTKRTDVLHSLPKLLLRYWQGVASFQYPE